MFRGWNIKKVSAILALVMVCSFALAAVIFFADYGFDGFKAFDNSSESPQDAVTVNEERTETLSGVKKLTIKTTSDDINIIPSDGTEVKAHYHGWYKSAGKDFNRELIVEKGSDELTIRIKYNDTISFKYSGLLTLDVYLPRTYSESLEVNATSADINIDELNLNSFDCNLTSGDITARLVNSKKASVGSTSGSTKINGKFDNFDYSSTSGDFTTEGITALNAKINTTSGSIRGIITSDNIELGSTSGDIQINQLYAKNTKSETSSGRTVLKGNPGFVEASATSGDISLEYDEFNSDIKVSTNSGSTSILLPPDPEFALNFKTVSGDGKCDFPITVNSSSDQRRGIVGVVTSDRNKITVSTTSGSMTIKQK